MKKNLFVVAAVALMALVSCNKEEINGGFEQESQLKEPTYFVEFTAALDNEDEAATKTTYNETDKKTCWEASDLISVNGQQFKIAEISADKLSARFVNVNQLPEGFGAPYVAVYPYAAGLSVSGQTVKGVVLNSNQTAKAASFASGAVPAIAYSATNNTLSFKNVCSLVKFKVSDANVKKVEISSNNGENLAGTVTLAYNNGTPTATVTSNGSSKVVLEGTFDATSTYYVASLASGLENGITVTLNGTIAKTVANELEFKRSKVMNAGTLALTTTSPQNSTTWNLKGDWNSWNDTTPMYYESGLYVARNVPMNGGFKMNSSTGTWIGGGSKLSLDTWHTVSSSGENMSLSSYSGNYDVYFSGDNNKMYITKAGSAAPSVWGVWVDGGAKDYAMTQVGQYYVAKAVALNANQNFKFRTFSDWNTNKGYGTVVAKKAYSLVANGSNMHIATKGTYDIYMTTNGAYGFVVAAGSSLNNADIEVDKKSIVGDVDGTSWGTDLAIYVMGDSFGRPNVKIGSGGFKFRQNLSWADADVWGKDTAGKLKQPGGNINDKTGTFTILVDHDFKTYTIK